MRVALHYVARDAAVAAELARQLRAAGIEVVESDSDQLPDGLIALISRVALVDDAWRAPAEGPEADRVVPVRLEEIDDERVPEPLRKLNWIDWTPERPAMAAGNVLASLFADPARYRLSLQLSHEADAWDRAGRPERLLIHHRGRASRMRALLGTLERDPLAVPSEAVRDFVAASDVATAKASRRRLLARLGAGGVVALAALAAAALIPQMRAQGRISRAAIVTAGNPAVLDELPEWSGANASALLLKGTATQRTLGRTTLVEALARPWAVGSVDFVDSVVALVPDRGGGRTSVLALAPGGSAFASVDVPRGEIRWTAPLPRRFDHMDLAADGGTAVVAGAGAGVVDLDGRRFSSRLRDGTFAGVRAVGSDMLLWREGGRLLELPIAGRAGPRRVGNYDAVLDVTAGRHGAAALVLRDGRYEIVDVAGGEAAAIGRLRPGAERLGALSPDGERAVVDGADGQLWTLGVGRPPRPTGIPVPALSSDLEWAAGGRVVLVSESRGAEVVFLPRAQRLGEICRGTAKLAAVRVAPAGDVVACGGGGRATTSLWALPPAPGRVVPAEAPPPARSYARVERRGPRLARIRRRGPLGERATGWFAPGDGAIAATALSPVDRQVAFGSSTGGVSVVGLTRTRATVLVTWRVPGSSPVTGLGWHDGGFVATTAAGQSWNVPGCRGCETDAGLLAEARSRISGCFTERQMSFIDEDVREWLGMRECPPVRVLEGS